MGEHDPVLCCGTREFLDFGTLALSHLHARPFGVFPHRGWIVDVERTRQALEGWRRRLSRELEDASGECDWRENLAREWRRKTVAELSTLLLKLDQLRASTVAPEIACSAVEDARESFAGIFGSEELVSEQTAVDVGMALQSCAALEDGSRHDTAARMSQSKFDFDMTSG